MLGSAISLSSINVQRAVVATTDSTTILDATQVLLLAPAATIAAGTVVFPTATDKRVFTLCATHTITALTLTSAKTVIGGITTLVAGSFASFLFSTADDSWVRVG